MTSKTTENQKLAVFKELVGQRRYQEARQVLLTLDHPRTVEWLRELDKRERQQIGRRKTIALISLAVVVVIVGGAFVGISIFRPQWEAMAWDMRMTAYVHEECSTEAAEHYASLTDFSYEDCIVYAAPRLEDIPRYAYGTLDAYETADAWTNATRYPIFTQTALAPNSTPYRMTLEAQQRR